MSATKSSKDTELSKLISRERLAHSRKVTKFKNRGKKFILNKYAGIVPDHVYDALRERSDKKFKLPKWTGKSINRATIRKIADGDRVYPVRYFVIHHSVGPDFVDGNHDSIAQWYSDVGKSRAYAGVAHSGHYYKGRETFASNHLVGHWHGGVWCVFAIIDDYWNCVSWGAGNWLVNQQAINIENCGRFTSPAPEGILVSLANWWRPQHNALGGNSSIVPHREVSQTGTACPERLGDQVPRIRQLLNAAPPPPAPSYNYVAEVGKAKVNTEDADDLFFLDAPRLSANIKGQVKDGTIMDYVGYVTNGDNVDGSTKWWKNSFNSYFSERYCKKIEAPAPIPPPTPPTPPTVAIKYSKLEQPVEYIATRDATLWDFNHAKHAEMREVVGGNKKKSDKVVIAGRAEHPTGSVYLMTAFSYDNSGKSPVPFRTNGFNQADMEVVKPTPPPTPNPSPVPVPPPVPTPTPPSPTPVDPNPTPSKSLWQQLLELFEKIKKALGG